MPTKRGALLQATVGAAVAAMALIGAEVRAQENAAPAEELAEILPLASSALLLDLTRAGERFVAVGERGHVLLSDDQGATWRQAKRVPTRVLLTGVFFANASAGWAVGHDEVILRTADGGETWQRVHYAPDAQQPLLDVWFADAQRGIAVGAFSTVYATSDGGVSWERRPFEPAPAKQAPPAAPADSEELDAGLVSDYHLNEIVSSGTRLYIAAEAGSLYRSDDGGETWKRLPSPYEGSFFGALPLGPDSVLAFGLRGHLFRSDDAGESWRRIETGTVAMLTGGTRIDERTLAIVGLAGVILVSRDGGETFTLQQQADRKGFAAALPGPAGKLATVGEAGARLIEITAGGAQ